MPLKDKIGIAIIGLGRIGESHIDAIRLNSEAAYLAAVVDIDQARAKATAERYHSKFYLSVAEALKDPSIQAAVVCLPHHLHSPVSCQVMEAGRHVLVEKPWAISLAEGKKALKKARDKGVVLMSGQSYRFMWALVEAKERVMKGEIGDPLNLLSVEANNFNKTNAPAWWREVRKTGGMAFTMLGAHTIDYTLWLYEGRKPVRVYSEARAINQDFEGMDEIIITVRFDDDSIATNYLSLNTRPEKHECFVVGPKGTLDVLYRRTGNLVGVFGSDLYFDGELVRSDSPAFHQFAVQMKEFLAAITQKRESIVKYSSLLMQTAIIEAAQKSAAAHQPVILEDIHFD